MPAWPKSLLNLGASFLTARTAARLRRPDVAAAQARTLDSLSRRLGATTYWREAGVEPGMDYETFRTRVAPRTPEQIAPAIARMKRGEADVLWPGRCAFFAATSGTTTGTPHHLPVTEEMLAHFQHAGREAMLYYTARVGHTGVLRGRHLLLGGSTALVPLEEAKPHEAYVGDLSGITALNLPAWAEQHLYEPGAAIAQMADWNEKLAAIVARTSALDLSLLAGIPAWVLQFVQALRTRHASGAPVPGFVQTLWPNLECCVHTGVPLAPYLDELRHAFGPAVTFHEIYAASEGFVAAQDGEASAGLRVLADAGLFFEFLPMADYDEARLEHLGTKAVPLAGVKTGVDYAVLVTTPGGLARHALGDIVRFLSTAPARLIYLGPTRLQLDAFGERVREKDVTDTLVAVCRKHDWTIMNFHVAPLFTPGSTGPTRGRHEWWIELRPGNVATPIGPPMAAALDAELQRRHDGYAAKRRTGAVEPPTVRLVMPGVFEHWLRFHGRWGGQHKMPRCRPDRLIADELAQVTNFARD